MKPLLLTILSIALSTGVWATEAIDLRFKGVQAASNGDFVLAQKYLSQSAKLGYYTAQVEYAYLLESSPSNVKNTPESYAWYSVVIARKGTDTDFAKDGLARMAKIMSATDIEQANKIAKKYIEQYAN